MDSRDAVRGEGNPKPTVVLWASLILANLLVFLDLNSTVIIDRITSVSCVRKLQFREFVYLG